MHVITKLNDAIRSSRRRTQAVPSQSAGRSVPLTTVQVEKRRKPKAEHTNTKQQRYIDSGCIRLKPQ